MAGKNVTIGNVNISMSANAAALIRQVDKADKHFTKKMKRMIKTSKRFAKAMVNVTKKLGRAAKIAGGVGAVAFGALALKTFEAQREMQRMADVAGVSMGTFAKMSHITKSLGLQTEYLADGMKDLNVRIVDAAKGGGTMVDFFTLMGENAEDWINLNPADQLDKFIKLTGKLSDNEAKFWADEVNDSMYRLNVTLRRSGKTIQEFQTEAAALGAGTAAGLIGSVNSMYEAFNRLWLILSEITGTSFSIFAESLTVAFNTATTALQTYINTMDGSTIGEKIFNFSKDMVTKILAGVAAVSSAISASVKYLDMFSEHGLSGVILWRKTMRDSEKEIIALTTKIATLKKSQEAESNLGGELSGRSKQISDFIIKQQNKLAALESSYAKMAGTMTTENSGIAQSITDMINSTNALKYNPSDAATGSSVNTNGQDPAELKLALDYLKAQAKLSTDLEDSELNKLALNRENLQALIAHYDKLSQTSNLTKVMEDNKIAAQFALMGLDDQEEARHKELLDEKVKAEKLAADKMVEIHQRMLEQRLAFDAQYGGQYQAMTITQEALEHARLAALREQEVITKEEHLSALAQVTQNKANSEVQMELTKLADIANGLQAFTGKSKTMAKAAFAFTQGKALQEVIMQQAQAVSAAWADPALPWYAKAGAAVMAAANVGKQIQTIKQAGQFHDGGEIPYDGTYYMEGGEMVIPKDRVGEYIDSAGGSGGGGGTVINSNITMGPSLVDEKVLATALSKQQSVIATLVRKEEKNRPSRNRSRNN